MPEENKPLVSIIVRTMDRPKLLLRALQSIAAQTYRPVEVVLVNDGGCDLDIEALKGLLGDISLNYQRLEKNTGRAHAGNTGIENAKGEYIGFLDDDDLLYENHVQTLVGFLRESDAGAAYSDAYIVKNKPTEDGYQPVSKEAVYSRNFDRDRLLFQNYIPLLCLMVKRELFVSEIFDTEFDIFEDWDLLIRLSRLATFQRISEITAEYHMRDDNITIELSPETFPHIEARYKVYRKHMRYFAERAISVFEAFHAESEHYKALLKFREEELVKAKAYMKDKEEELGSAISYCRKIEEKLEKTQKYIKEQEENLVRTQGYFKHSDEETNRTSACKSDKECESSRKEKGIVSIVVLTYNGEQHIKNLLDSIFTQEIDWPVEVIMIDSSSDDATRKIAEGYNVKLHVINQASFSHPKTRNIGVSLSGGKYIVFITQDALPANADWLRELIRPLENFPNMAASYSRQIPRLACNPLEARDIYIGAPCIDEVRHANLWIDWQKNDYTANIHRYIRFSNVSACYNGEILRNNPFDERITMVEDQEWSKRMIEKGHAIYYSSKSVVMHSHEFGLKEVYKRHFDYGLSFRQFLSQSPPKRTSFLKATAYDFLNDLPYILNDNRRLRSKLKWICKSPLLRFAAHYGLYKGWNRG